MSRAGSVAGLARFTEMAAQPGITWGGPARLRLNLEAVVWKDGCIKEHESSAFTFANPLFWCIIFSFTWLYGLINHYVLYRKRSIDLLVSHFALKRNLVTKKCSPCNRDYMVNFSPVSRDPGIAIPGSQLAGLRFFHVIVKLIFSVSTAVPKSRQTEPARLM